MAATDVHGRLPGHDQARVAARTGDVGGGGVAAARGLGQDLFVSGMAGLHRARAGQTFQIVQAGARCGGIFPGRLDPEQQGTQAVEMGRAPCHEAQMFAGQVQGVLAAALLQVTHAGFHVRRGQLGGEQLPDAGGGTGLPRSQDIGAALQGQDHRGLFGAMRQQGRQQVLETGLPAQGLDIVQEQGIGLLPEQGGRLFLQRTVLKKTGRRGQDDAQVLSGKGRGHVMQQMALARAFFAVEEEGAVPGLPQGNGPGHGQGEGIAGTARQRHLVPAVIMEKKGVRDAGRGRVRRGALGPGLPGQDIFQPGGVGVRPGGLHGCRKIRFVRREPAGEVDMGKGDPQHIAGRKVLHDQTIQPGRSPAIRATGDAAEQMPAQAVAKILKGNMCICHERPLAIRDLLPVVAKMFL